MWNAFRNKVADLTVRYMRPGSGAARSLVATLIVRVSD
jgi:hypothetical protein